MAKIDHDAKAEAFVKWSVWVKKKPHENRPSYTTLAHAKATTTPEKSDLIV